MDTTRRRFASMSCCFASKPTCSMRPRRRFSRRSSSMPSSSALSSSSMAATPASIFMARSISSAAVSKGTLPISLRYMRTGSPVSMVTPASAPRLRAAERTLLLVTFGSWTSTVALSSSSGMPSSRSSSSPSPPRPVSSLSSSRESAATTSGSASSASSSSISSASIGALAETFFVCADACFLEAWAT